MKQKRVLVAGISLLLILTLLPLGALAKTVKVETNGTVNVKDYDKDTLTVTEYSMYTATGTKIAVGDEVAYQKDITNLLSAINDGEMNASKNGCFEDNDDAKEGISKITFDIAGKPLSPVVGKDILFVLDESGSMNMGTTQKHTSAATCPCLNEDHYYRIPASLVEAVTSSSSLASLSTMSADTASDIRTFSEGDAEEIVEMTETEQNLPEEDLQAETIEGSNETPQTEVIEERTESFQVETAVLEAEDLKTEVADAEAATEEESVVTESSEEEQDVPEEASADDGKEAETKEETTEPKQPAKEQKEMQSEGAAKEALHEEVAVKEVQAATTKKTAPVMMAGPSRAGSSPLYIDANGDVYFRLIDLGQKSLDIWGSFDNNIINNELNALGLQLKNKDSSNWIYSWYPWNNHYKKDNSGAFVHITPATTSQYCSPVGNSDGCFDRMMLEKDCVKSIISFILDPKNNSRVGVVGFNGTVTTHTDFEKDETTVKNALNTYTGAGNTHYDDALNRAITLINGRTDTTRVPVVIFISDGEPYPDTQKPSSATLAALKATGADVYAVGMNLSGSEDDIKKVSSNYKNCKTAAEFTAYIQELYEIIIKGKADAVLSDEIGGDYDLIVDNDHPITVDGKTYTSIASLPSGVTYSNKKFSYKLPIVDQKGTRVSFYVQLDQAIRTDTTSTTKKAYDTNGDAGLTYYKANLQSGNVIFDQNPTNVPLQSPYIEKGSSVLKASVVSDKMVNNDPTVMGQEVKNGDVITYTITVVNTGTEDATDVVIENIIPKDTQYIPGSASGNGKYDTSANDLTWKLPSVPAGGTETVSFQVKVTSSDTDFTKEIITETFKWGWDDDDYKKTGQPQLQGNKLENPTPVPAPGSVVITNTVQGNAGDKTKDFHYTITYTDDKTGKIVTETFTLKDGETKRFDNLRDGTTYTVTQTDANKNGYTTNMVTAVGNISSGKTAQEDYINEKNQGTVKITNTVKGNAADPNKDFHYTLTYVDENGKTVTETFTLKHGESRSFDHLPDGTSYTVTQTDANTDGYITNMVVATGIIDKNKPSQEDYVNEKNKSTPQNEDDKEDGGKTKKKTSSKDKNNKPHTGDSGHFVFWMSMMLLAALVAVGSLAYKKRSIR